MKMEKPTVEVVRFQNSDVIATSDQPGGQPAVQPGVQLGGFGNGTDGDWFVSNVQGATSGKQDQSTVLGYFNAASGRNDTGYYQIYLYPDTNTGSEGSDLTHLVGYEEFSSSNAKYNGWYIWNSEKNYFVKFVKQ